MENEARINWIVRADVECPHCNTMNDFMVVDDWYSYTQVADNSNFDTPVEMTCKDCGKEIHVTGSDY